MSHSVQSTNLRGAIMTRLVAVLGGALLGACTVGPDYKKPSVVTPPSYGWKVAEPRDKALKGEWWKYFRDPVLDRLETEASQNNQNLKAAIARVDQARAVARGTASRFFPQLSFDPSVSHFHTQRDHIPSRLTATATTLQTDLSYEVDLWGRVRRAYESSMARAEASAADFYQVLLTLHGDVAINYFLLRQTDSQIALLQRTVGLRQKAVDLVGQRVQKGMTAELDLDRAQIELAQAKTTLTEMQRQRNVLQDSIGLLCGQPASSFHIDSGELQERVPKIPVGLPSELLERRPDIAQAERKMAAANAQIGAAKAAFFPAISLTGNAGYSSFHVSSLLDWESRLYQIGPSVSLPLFNGGRLRAGLKEAQASYSGECANYRQTVLAAFKEVTDSLNDLDAYSREAVTESEAVAHAARASSSSKERYTQGLVTYVDVLDSERTELQTELQATQILGLRMISTVRLIKALGGGFSSGAG